MILGKGSYSAISPQRTEQGRLVSALSGNKGHEGQRARGLEKRRKKPLGGFHFFFFFFFRVLLLTQSTARFSEGQPGCETVFVGVKV